MMTMLRASRDLLMTLMMTAAKTAMTRYNVTKTAYNNNNNSNNNNSNNNNNMKTI